MRELKFRYWNGIRMIQPENIRFIDFNHKLIDYFDIDTQEYNEEEYCDRFPMLICTGRKDENNKMIFEGDIVEFFDILTGKLEYGVVKLKDGYFMIGNYCLYSKKVRIVCDR